MMSAHVAHTMEMGAFLNRNDWGSNITDECAGLENLDLFSGRDDAIYFATIHEHADRYDALDHGMLSDD